MSAGSFGHNLSPALTKCSLGGEDDAVCCMPAVVGFTGKQKIRFSIDNDLFIERVGEAFKKLSDDDFESFSGPCSSRLRE